jgi:type IV pilus assembly protein PilA
MREKGFTLIELMIVIAIVAILVTIAVPAYQTFSIRAKVAECISASAPYKTSISEFRQTNGQFPANMAEAGIYTGPQTSQYCRYFMYNNARGPMGDFAVEVDMAAISPSMTLPRMQLIMSPVVSHGGAIDWYCTRGWGGPESLKYMPTNCRGPNIYR